MDTKTSKFKHFSSILLAVATGYFLALGYSLNPSWWAPWLAPTTGLLAIILAPKHWQFGLGFCAGLGATAATFSYLIMVGGLPVAIIVTLLFGLGWGTSLRLAARAFDKGSTLSAMIALPTFWAAIDTITIYVSPHGTAGTLAYSQASVLPVIQLASLGGIPAVTFLLLLPGSLAGIVLASLMNKTTKRLVLGAGVLTLVCTAAICFGMLRLTQAVSPMTKGVTMLASDRPAPNGRTWEQFEATYLDEIERSAKRGETLLLPEAVLSVSDQTAEVVAKAVAQSALEKETTIVIGMAIKGADKSTNRALVALPNGRYIWYEKQHLVPGLESNFTPGNVGLTVPTAEAKLGIAICRDMYFPALGRDYALAGANLMLIPANDFQVDDRAAMALTLVRGVEGGFSIARAARNGISFVSDPYGRVLAEKKSAVSTQVLTAQVPLGLAQRTIYARFGDVFGGTCILGWLGLWFSNRQTRRLRSAAM
jgi:apolipoprotein N-acyltransferase